MSDLARQSRHQEIVEQNRQSWNAASAAHNSHRGSAASFLQGGGTTLFPEETQLLGDLSGRKVVHLLCGAGHDSLSLANLGADVIGVDLSDEAITSATRLVEQVGSHTQFIRADVYDWLADPTHRGTFDHAFASYGVLWWLDDLDRFMSGVSAALRRGGRFTLIDFHPSAMMLDRRLTQRFPYSTHGNPVPITKGVGDYVGKSGDGLVPWGFREGVRHFRNPVPCNIFLWSLAEIWEAMARARLDVSMFSEYEYCNGYRMFDILEPDRERRRWVFPADAIPFSLMFSFSASKAS